MTFLVPGIINRFPGLNDDNRITGTGTPDDVVVRSFDKDEAEVVIENNNSSSTTTTTEEPTVQKRSIDDSIILTRKGVYRVLESRLSA